ncbi:MAG TPA: hypothetical protein VJR89_17045 [Polyangiales bacterium]|nr:hypothetical protein [Polyangiales bacterium]
MLRAIVVCALLVAACDIEPATIGVEVDAGSRTESQKENGGFDLAPEPKPKRAAQPAEQPAADSGMPAADEPEPQAEPAAAPSHDAGPQDAGPQDVPAMPDSGKLDAALEDDAGVEDPDQPATCTTRDCLCESYCERGLSLGCLDEPPLLDCLGQCRSPITPGCEAPALAAVRCKVERPMTAYRCDDILWAFVVDGCEAADEAAQICRTR